MNHSELKDFLELNNIQYETEIDLSKKTWIHRGGVAGFYISPDNVGDLQKVCTFLYEKQYPFLLIGHTSNMYIHNDANIDIVVSTAHCNAFSIQENIIECDCGAAVSKVARASIEKGLQGMEYLTTLPGTIGAAICNNSTVKDSKVSELLVDLDFLGSDGLVRVLTPADLQFSFRNSALKSQTLKGVILKVRLRLSAGDAAKLNEIAKKNEERRKKTLEGPSQNLGCTVNRTFSKGKMPRKYEIPLNIYSKLISIFVPSEKRKAKTKRFLLGIAGYKELAPYISDKQMITFIWKDDKADLYFPRYLEFMSRVYQTDFVEIQEVKKV